MRLPVRVRFETSNGKVYFYRRTKCNRHVWIDEVTDELIEEIKLAGKIANDMVALKTLKVVKYRK